MGQLAGRSPYLQSVHIAVAADRIGEIVPASDFGGDHQ